MRIYFGISDTNRKGCPPDLQSGACVCGSIENAPLSEVFFRTCQCYYSNMTRPVVWWFLGLSVVFATTHALAVALSLYWYVPWFDSVMHAWGGGLIVIGLFSFSTFSQMRRNPELIEVVVVLAIITVTWEVFEWYIGLWDPATYVVETIKDITVAAVSGIITYRILR